MAKKQTKGLKNLGRRALLELLLEQTQENEDLKLENEKLKAELETAKAQSAAAPQGCGYAPASKPVVAARAPGTMAEAALKVAGVLNAADEAARIFLSSVEQNAKERAAEHYEMQLKAQTYAAKIINEAHEEARRIRKNADDYWYQMLRMSENRMTPPMAEPAAPSVSESASEAQAASSPETPVLDENPLPPIPSFNTIG